jgi:porin
MRWISSSATRIAPPLLALLGAVAPASRAQTASADGAAAQAVSTSFTYTGELAADVAGGARHGATYVGAAALQFTVRLDRLASWRGAQLFIFGLATHGGAPSDQVGDVQGVNNLQARPGVRLEEIWLQQNLFEDRLSLLAGRYDLNTEFYRLQSAALFVNSSLGMGPEFAQSGVAGPSVFPNTSVGVRVDFKPSRNVVWRGAVFDGVPVDRPGGGIHLFAPGDGALLAGEVALLSRPDTGRAPRDRRFMIGRGAARPYADKLAFGVWYYTGRFPDLADTLVTGAPLMHRGSRGAYIIGDHTVWSGRATSPVALTAFAQLGVGDSRVNQIGGYFGSGLTLTGPFAGRADDELGLAVAAASMGSHFRRAQPTADEPAPAEITIELTYLAQAISRLSIQPDLQYVIHPGGSRVLSNALVPGLRIALAY